MKGQRTSLAKITANRQKALKSTQARRREGEGGAKHNAVKHALLAKSTLIRTGAYREGRTEFERLFARLREDFEPQGALEEILVERLAVSYWRLRRVLRYEVAEIQSEGWRRTKIASLLGHAPPTSLLPSDAAVARLVRYGTMLDREFYRALDRLDIVQRRRAGEPTLPPVAVNLSGNIET